MTMTHSEDRARAAEGLAGDSGATMVSYAIVTGAIAVLCAGAVTYLNWNTEEKIQARSEQSGTLATNHGSASLAGEVAKSTAIMGGVELPFQFGLPLFALPTRRKHEKKKGDDQEQSREVACKSGKCGSDEGTCFVAGTLVLTPSGYRKIEDIRVGDEVLSVAEDSPWATAQLEEEPSAGEPSVDFSRKEGVEEAATQ